MTIYAVESEVNFVCESALENIEIEIFTANVGVRMENAQSANMYLCLFHNFLSQDVGSVVDAFEFCIVDGSINKGPSKLGRRRGRSFLE